MGNYKLWMSDLVFYDDNEVLFSAGQFNGLFKADLRVGKAEFISPFPNERRLQSRLHSVAIKYKDEIIFFPDLSKYITIYNVRNNAFLNIEYPIENKNSTMKYLPKIVSGILVGSSVYAFSSKDPCILRYDFHTRKLKVYHDWVDEFKSYGYKENTSFFCRDICQAGKSILARTYQNNVIVEFNIESEKVLFHQIEEKTAVVICGNEDKAWLISEEGTKLYTWNIKKRMLESIEPKKELKNIRNYQCSVEFQGEVWFFPYLYRPVLILDQSSNKYKIKEMFNITVDEKYSDNILGSVWFKKVYNGNLYMMSVLENKIYCFSDSNCKVFCTEIYIDRTVRNKYLLQEKNMRHFSGIMLEEEDSI